MSAKLGRHHHECFYLQVSFLCIHGWRQFLEVNESVYGASQDASARAADGASALYDGRTTTWYSDFSDRDSDPSYGETSETYSDAVFGGFDDSRSTVASTSGHGSEQLSYRQVGENYRNSDSWKRFLL